MKTLSITILAILAFIFGAVTSMQAHWYTDTSSVQTTIQWQSVTITTTTEWETQCREVMDTSVQDLVVRAQAMFTFQEWETIQDYLLYKGWCGTYPTTTSCKSYEVRNRSETSPYCGDDTINTMQEECYGGINCSNTCQIIKPKAETYAPVYNYPIVVPTGAGDASIYDSYFF